MNSLKLANARRALVQPTTRALELFMLSFILILATSTIFLMIGLQLSAKFSAVTFQIIIATLLTLITITYAIIKHLSSSKTKREDINFFLVVLTLSFLVGILCTSINRPDRDDSVYAPKAVFYTENPNAILNRSVNWISFPNQTPTSGVIPYYELTQAAFAILFNRRYLDIYHIVMPFIVGFLICLSTFLVIRIFEPRQNIALLSTLLFVLLLLALGETHRTYGNFSIARAFQGKCMFISVGVSSWIYFSLRYFIVRDKLSWIALVALGIGMAGATTTAMIFLPILALCISVSYYLNENRSVFSISELKQTISYFASLIPLMVMAVNFRSYAISNISSGSQINAGFPKEFNEQIKFLINPDYPLTPVVFAISLTVVIIFSGYRKFFISWVSIIIVLLLNPLVSDFVIENLTTENIYWRLFYLLPFPILICLAFAISLRANWGWRASTIFLLILLVPTAIWGPTSVLRSKNGVAFGIPGYKIASHELSMSKLLVDKVACGSMFAPLEISSNILLLSSHYPQVHMREDYLGLMLGKVGELKEFDERVRAYGYLFKADISHDGKTSFLKIIGDKGKPNNIIVPVKTTNYGEIVNELKKEGYGFRFYIDNHYELFSVSESMNHALKSCEIQ